MASSGDLPAMRSALARHLGSRQVSRVLYGSIIGLALVVALEAHPPAPGVVAATLLGTAIAVGLAELYSEILGTATRTRTRIERHHLSDIAEEVGAVVIGIAFPAVFFLLAAVGAIDDDAAFDIAKWSGLALIASYGFAAARLTGDTVIGALGRAALAGFIAAFLIVLKALLH
jgi:hypothetical protein